MKVRSNIPLPFNADRMGIHTAIIEIDFRIESRNDIDKTYGLVAIDYTINDHITTSMYSNMPVEMRPIGGMYGGGRREIARKQYVKSYAEYDAQREYLLSMDDSGLTGSALEDKLLQDALLYSCITDTIYSSGYEDWVAYVDPIPEPIVVPEPTPEPTPTPVVSAPILNEYDNVTVTGTADPEASVTVYFDFEAVTTSFDVAADSAGLFEYTPVDALAAGTVITATASNTAGDVSEISNSITVTI